MTSVRERWFFMLMFLIIRVHYTVSYRDYEDRGGDMRWRQGWRQEMETGDGDRRWRQEMETGMETGDGETGMEQEVELDC